MDYTPKRLPEYATGYITGECVNTKHEYIGNITLHGKADGFIAVRAELWEDYHGYGKKVPRLKQGQLIDFGPFRLRYVRFDVATFTSLFVIEGRLWPAIKYWATEWLWMMKSRIHRTFKIWFPKGLET